MQSVGTHSKYVYYIRKRDILNANTPYRLPFPLSPFYEGNSATQHNTNPKRGLRTLNRVDD